MSQAGASRPQTPAVSLHFEQHALELGSECPPTPEVRKTHKYDSVLNSSEPLRPT